MKPRTPGHRVLVKPRTLADTDNVFASAAAAGIKWAEKTEIQESSIIDTGTVVEIGPTAFEDYGGADKWCNVGDLISYARYGGKTVSDPDDKDTKWLIINDEDVIMVWEKV
jgi:co-chaperonin GroES (HSP10)